MNRKCEEVFQATVEIHIHTVRQLLEKPEVLAGIADAMLTTLRNGGKILFCGNGALQTHSTFR